MVDALFLLGQNLLCEIGYSSWHQLAELTIDNAFEQIPDFEKLFFVSQLVDPRYGISSSPCANLLCHRIPDALG